MQPAFAEWIPDIPEAGEYAVYVSYASLPLSARDARYTVHHKGGSEVFRVNQQMGGGTWIYLGTFSFDEGRNVAGRVTLSNESREVNAIVTADAVKFGGGMGNMGRMVQDTSLVSHFGNISFPPQISGYPRFTEGARYWLQYAGFSDTVYTYYEGDNDYTDDYSSRGRWVNTLAGGSEKHPGNPGLKIPVDLSFSFHTDAGVTKSDSIIGTLAIYTRDSDGTELLPTGHSRLTSRDYTDLVQTQIVNDLRALWNPDWTRRGIWNRSYSESRSPQIPAMLLELLSHQNFADMRYGLDPLFRFTVSRAIYKGMLRYLSSTAGFEYVVQPLPVNRIAVNFNDSGNALLTWEPTEDLLEPTARARGYIVYTRTGGRTASFDSGTYVEANRAEIPVEPGRHYSFRVTAVNSGGESFPSQVVSLFKVPRVMKRENSDRERIHQNSALTVTHHMILFMPDSPIIPTTEYLTLKISPIPVPSLNSAESTTGPMTMPRDSEPAMPIGRPGSSRATHSITPSSTGMPSLRPDTVTFPAEWTLFQIPIHLLNRKVFLPWT